MVGALRASCEGLVVRQWWAGLAPGDRRTAGVFMGVIVGTLPVYMVLLTLISLSAPPRVESQVVVSPGPSVVLPPSPSPAPTETPSPSATPSQTETPSPSATPSATATALATASPAPQELPS